MRNAGLFTSQRHVANNYSKNALFLLSQKGKLKTKISNSHIFLTTIIRVSDSGETPNVSPPQILVLSINYETNPQFGTWSPLKLFTPPPPPQEFFLHSTKLVYQQMTEVDFTRNINCSQNRTRINKSYRVTYNLSLYHNPRTMEWLVLST